MGGVFVMRLLGEAPERVTAAAALQAVGLAGNRNTFVGLFDSNLLRAE
jgi:hypothetical protein